MSDNLICFALMVVFLVPFIVSNKKGEILLEFEIENNCKSFDCMEMYFSLGYGGYGVPKVL